MLLHRHGISRMNNPVRIRRERVIATTFAVLLVFLKEYSDIVRSHFIKKQAITGNFHHQCNSEQEGAERCSDSPHKSSACSSKQPGLGSSICVRQEYSVSCKGITHQKFYLLHSR